MEIVHVYTKKRAEFGRQYNFTDRPAELNIDVYPDSMLTAEFIERNPRDTPSHCEPEMSEDEVKSALPSSRSKSETIAVYALKIGATVGVVI